MEMFWYVFGNFGEIVLQQIFAQILKLQSVTSQIGKLECHKSKQVISLRSPFCYIQIKIWHICCEIFIISHDQNICQQVNVDDMNKGYESLCKNISFYLINLLLFSWYRARKMNMRCYIHNANVKRKRLCLKHQDDTYKLDTNFFPNPILLLS